MHDLATIQRMNAEAVATHQRKEAEVYGLLSDMLYEYDELDGDVDNFILSWVEKFMK